MDNQFYPTPPVLKAKVWSKITRKITRVLEPSAGEGDLIKNCHDTIGKVDVIELDVSRHPILREKGFRVIGSDFLSFEGGIPYSHIIMNPPFNQGVDHVLHAWNLLIDGELIAILNSETIKNPFSAKREQLVKLIDEFGSVEFSNDEFMDPLSKRKTPVEVAIVHLEKRFNGFVKLDFEGLDKDQTEFDVDGPKNLIIPDSAIHNMVKAFKMAAKHYQDGFVSMAIANYHMRFLGKFVRGEDDPPEITFDNVRENYAEKYDKLKETAWKNVFDSVDFTSRFSNKTRDEVRQKLDELKTLEFTVENIHAILQGMIEQKSDLDFQMVEEGFDLITRYHSENREYYMGWKSNDKHRIGWKIKHTRFILPNAVSGYMATIKWEFERTLQDIERVFMFLDGKHVTEEPDGLAKQAKESLETGRRISGEYFDVRVYFGKRTCHFFPNRIDLIERMNRIVGQRRQWLSDRHEPSEAYEKADKVTKAMTKELDKVEEYRRHRDEEIEKAYRKVIDEMGIDTVFKIERKPSKEIMAA